MNKAMTNKEKLVSILGSEIHEFWRYGAVEGES